ncbi:MAG: hypothetical protein ACREEP_04920, partial [Dongiaceae bacterium]
PSVERRHVQAAIARALRAPEMKEKCVNLGLGPTGTTPEELVAIMAADTARCTPVVKPSGFTAD